VLVVPVFFLLGYRSERHAIGETLGSSRDSLGDKELNLLDRAARSEVIVCSHYSTREIALEIESAAVIDFGRVATPRRHGRCCVRRVSSYSAGWMLYLAALVIRLFQPIRRPLDRHVGSACYSQLLHYRKCQTCILNKGPSLDIPQ
jgi:hypothetical protein